MRLVKFIETRAVKDAEGRVFVAGETYELPDASADRWIARGVAVAVDALPQPESAPMVAEDGTPDFDAMTRPELFAYLRAAGETPAPATKDDTLRARAHEIASNADV